MLGYGAWEFRGQHSTLRLPAFLLLYLSVREVGAGSLGTLAGALVLSAASYGVRGLCVLGPRHRSTKDLQARLLPVSPSGLQAAPPAISGTGRLCVMVATLSWLWSS